jgi:adenosylmethionine-8-amino-7-oxononanoate aminotransferase
MAMSEAEFVAHCVAELEALIDREGADTIAAFIGEPALGTGGHRAAARRLLARDPGGAAATTSC